MKNGAWIHDMFNDELSLFLADWIQGAFICPGENEKCPAVKFCTKDKTCSGAIRCWLNSECEVSEKI